MKNKNLLKAYFYNLEISVLFIEVDMVELLGKRFIGMVLGYLYLL